MKTHRFNSAHFCKTYTRLKACYPWQRFPKAWCSGTYKADFILVSNIWKHKVDKDKETNIRSKCILFFLINILLDWWFWLINLLVRKNETDWPLQQKIKLQIKLILMKLPAKSAASSSTTSLKRVWTVEYTLLWGSVFRGKFWNQNTWNKTF